MCVFRLRVLDVVLLLQTLRTQLGTAACRAVRSLHPALQHTSPSSSSDSPVSSHNLQAAASMVHFLASYYAPMKGTTTPKVPLVASKQPSSTTHAAAVSSSAQGTGGGGDDVTWGKWSVSEVRMARSTQVAVLESVWDQVLVPCLRGRYHACALAAVDRAGGLDAAPFHGTLAALDWLASIARLAVSLLSRHPGLHTKVGTSAADLRQCAARLVCVLASTDATELTVRCACVTHNVCRVCVCLGALERFVLFVHLLCAVACCLLLITCFSSVARLLTVSLCCCCMCCGGGVCGYAGCDDALFLSHRCSATTVPHD